jgi:hypothetical protein
MRKQPLDSGIRYSGTQQPAGQGPWMMGVILKHKLAEATNLLGIV